MPSLQFFSNGLGIERARLLRAAASVPSAGVQGASNAAALLRLIVAALDRGYA